MFLTATEKEYIQLEAKKELACREFYSYNQLMMPNFYKPDRLYLKEISDTLQMFIEGKLLKESGEPYTKLMLNAPPRHGKTLTASNFCEWQLGKNPASRIIVGNYNEKLSGRFGKKVRNTIQERKASEDEIVYSDIFDIKIQFGDASYQLWSLEGEHFSFLSTSPSGTATGFGANILIIEDLVKNAEEAFNELRLEDLYNWYRNTMLSRLEEGGLQIINMTRWATNDLCGRLLDEQPGEWSLITYKAYAEGEMLCDEILSYESYQDKIKLLSPEIANANYNQIPIDLEGRLYKNLKTYTEIPKDENGHSLFNQIRNYTDTADEGDDYLCSINYGVYNGEAYILDVYYTKEGMETTEPKTAEMLIEGKVNRAKIESNNGGKGFARNVSKEIWDKYQTRSVIIKWFHQSKNKRARIMTNSSFVQEHIYFPINWRDRFPEFYKDVTQYQKEGRNKNDDAQDCLSGIAEDLSDTNRIRFA